MKVISTEFFFAGEEDFPVTSDTYANYQKAIGNYFLVMRDVLAGKPVSEIDWSYMETTGGEPQIAEKPPEAKNPFMHEVQYSMVRPLKTGPKT